MTSLFEIPNSTVTVTSREITTEHEILSFPALNKWHAQIKASLALQDGKAKPYKLKHIHVQAIDFFGLSAGFMKISTTVMNEDKDALPGAILLCGGSSGILVILHLKDAPAEKYVLLTVQPRIPAGSLEFVELPAGMMDKGTFSGAAAKEIQEELDIEFREDELINLTELAIPQGKEGGENLPRAMFSSPGGCDEYIQLFFCEKELERKQIEAFKGNPTGLGEEGKKIALKLVKLEDLWWEGARDAKALGALALYENLKRVGKL